MSTPKDEYIEKARELLKEMSKRTTWEYAPELEIIAQLLEDRDKWKKIVDQLCIKNPSDRILELEQDKERLEADLKDLKEKYHTVVLEYEERVTELEAKLERIDEVMSGDFVGQIAYRILSGLGGEIAEENWTAKHIQTEAKNKASIIGDVMQTAYLKAKRGE